MWMPETLGDFNNYLKISEITRYTQKLDISNVLQSSVFQQETFQHLKKNKWRLALSSLTSYFSCQDLLPFFKFYKFFKFSAQQERSSGPHIYVFQIIF